MAKAGLYKKFLDQNELAYRAGVVNAYHEDGKVLTRKRGTERWVLLEKPRLDRPFSWNWQVFEYKKVRNDGKSS